MYCTVHDQILPLVVSFLMLVLIVKVKSEPLLLIEEQINGTEILPLTNHLKSLIKNQPTNFVLIEDNSLSSSLSIDSITGLVTVKSRIDRESLCYQIPTKCIIPLKFIVTPMFQTITVTIEIGDINDNAPSWSQKQLSLDIIEFDGKKFEDRVLYVDKASDPDANENGSITYFLTERDGVTTNGDFKIRYLTSSSNRLVLYPLKIIDKEETDSYEMVLLAVDNGSPRKTGSLSVNVLVLDRNDNAPIFERPQYRNDALSETAPIGTRVFTVSATDKDSNDNGRISYRIDNRIASSYFEIDNKGQLTVKFKLDYDYGVKSFRFNVIAFDNAPEVYRKTGECEVFVHLKDENDETPEILVHFTTKDPASGQPNIKENHVINNFVLAHVQVKDADFGATDRVTCTLSQNNKLILEMSSTSFNEYRISATSSFDREELSREKLELTCLDQAHNKAVKSIVFQITDENDNSPVFPRNFHFYVKENSTQIMIVGDVRAVDRDEGNNSRIDYTIEEDSVYFRIDNHGRIYTQQILDREETSRFNLTILAVDGGAPSRTGSTIVIIDVVDVNDWRPEFNCSVYEFNISENSQLGTQVGVVAATDGDSVANTFIKYRIMTAPSPRLPFKMIQNQFGQLLVTHRLDREAQNEYLFIVTAEDNGRPISLTSSATVKVTITDVNDNVPIFVTKHHTKFSVQMSELVGFEIGGVTAHDADIGDNAVINYRIVAGNRNKLFDLNLLTGKLSLALQITTGSGDRKLVIEACDKGTPKLCSLPLLVTITVTKSSNTDNGEAVYVEHQTDSRTLIFIICVIVIILLILLILIICAFLFKNRLCVPVSKDTASDIRTNEADVTNHNVENRFDPNSNNESILVTSYPFIVPPGSTIFRKHALDSSLPFRERQISSDYQSIDGGSPPHNQGTAFIWDADNIQSPVSERHEPPLYCGHRAIKDCYYPTSPALYPGSYSTYNTTRFCAPAYGIRMANIANAQDMIHELPHQHKRYSSLLNFDSLICDQNNDNNYKSLRKTNPKASFV